MTAQAEEVEGAVAEGAEILTLQAPLRIEADDQGRAAALWTQPQIIGEVDRRAVPGPALRRWNPGGFRRISSSWPSDRASSPTALNKAASRFSGAVPCWRIPAPACPIWKASLPGGDCVTGPATVIRAIAAGKAAAANIDEYLGFHHEIETEVKVPTPG